MKKTGSDRGREFGNCERDNGFSLVELLIVIVILGVLATITVFAVRGITDDGQENSDAADLDIVQTAIEAYWVQHTGTPTEQALVGAGFLSSESAIYDLVPQTDGSFDIVNARTGATVESYPATSATTVTTATTVPTTVSNTVPSGAGLPTAGTPTTFAGLSAMRYGTPGSGLTVVVVGGPIKRAEWDATFGSSPTLSGNYRQWIYVDRSSITTNAQMSELWAAMRATNPGNGVGDISQADVDIPWAGGTGTLGDALLSVDQNLVQFTGFPISEFITL